MTAHAALGFLPILAFASLLLALAAPPARAATFTVTTDADTDDGVCDANCSLREAINEANATAGADVIDFDPMGVAAPITLASSLPAIDDDLEIDGSAVADLEIDGSGTYRVFFVEGGAVTIADLTVENGLGRGGDGAGRGGGGLGAGGGLFVNDGAEVTLRNVEFDGNEARGGDGGPGVDGGGGGGFGGSGGANDPVGGGAGGGGGFNLDGSAADGGDGSADQGGDGGGLLGGAGGGLLENGADGGSFGGGGGAGPGLVGGSPFAGDGGDGGAFGGGGGATGSGQGGDGGFGGGGGGAGSEGSAGDGGFGAGDGASSGRGDGGSGLGGAIFVRQGGMLTVEDGGFGNEMAMTSNAVTAGEGAAPGEARGSDLFVQQGVEAGFSVSPMNTVALEGSISGEGGIRKSGLGELVLRGANDYSGGTAVGMGTLRGDTQSLQGDIANDATVVFDGDEDGTYAGVMRGAGGLVKEGAGALTLTGANTYSGKTTVDAGTLEGDTTSFPGDIDVAKDTTVVFDQSGDGTWQHTIADADPMDAGATVVKRGDGALVIEGALGHAGTTEIEAGRLTLASSGSIFDSVDVQSGGSLGGSGSVGGNVAVEAGGEAAMEAPGFIAGEVDVQSGGRFGGTGTVGMTLIVRGSGTVAPGLPTSTTPGDTLPVDAVVFEPASIFEVKVDLGGTDADLLYVANDATIDDPTATVVVQPLAGGAQALGETYTILDADGMLSGEFAPEAVLPTAPDEGFAFLDTLVTSDFANDLVQLEIAPNGETLLSVADTRNQKAVGAALCPADPPDPAGAVPCPSATGDLATVFASLQTLSVSQVQRALDEIGGEALSAFTTAQLANGEQFVRTITSRLGILGGRAVGSPGTVGPALFRSGSGGELGGLRPDLGRMLADASSVGALRLGAAGPAVSAVPGEGRRRFGAWLGGYGLRGELEGDGNSADTDWSGGGVALGLDFAIGEHGLLGVSAGYGYLEVGVKDRSLGGDANVFQGALYGSLVLERFHLGGLTRYAYADFGTKRHLVFGGIDRDAEADFDGHEVGGYLEAGFLAFAPAGVHFEPLAAVHYTWLKRGSFDESGAGSLNLEVQSETWNSLVGSVGLRVHRIFDIDPDDGLRFVPEIWLRWAHQFGDRDRDLHARISGVTADGAYQVLGAEAARDGADFGVGWSIRRGRDLGFFMSYDATVNPDLIGHALAVGILIRW